MFDVVWAGCAFPCGKQSLPKYCLLYSFCVCALKVKCDYNLLSKFWGTKKSTRYSTDTNATIRLFESILFTYITYSQFLFIIIHNIFYISTFLLNCLIIFFIIIFSQILYVLSFELPYIKDFCFEFAIGCIHIYKYFIIQIELYILYLYISNIFNIFYYSLSLYFTGHFIFYSIPIKHGILVCPLVRWWHFVAQILYF